MATRTGEDRGQWATELETIVRAASGGMLFGVPLLYTVEVWSTGSHTSPAQALAVLGLTFVPVLLLNRTAGFRSTRDVRMRDALMDTVEAVGLGLVIATLLLILLREISGDTPLGVGLGKIVYEALPFCLGIAVATHFLSRGRDEGDDADDGERDGDGQPDTDDDTGLNATFADLGATVIGSVFVALNIAPTDEVPLLASRMRPGWLLAIVAVSLITSYGIVFAAGFSRQESRHAQVGIFQRPSTETITCYLIALFSAALMLWLFQKPDGPWQLTLSHVVVLGLPAAVGGAAGRLAI